MFSQMMLLKEPLEPLTDVGITPSKQSCHSRSSAKENPGACTCSRKRKRSVIDTDDAVSKRLCKDSELHSSLQGQSRQDLSDELRNPCQTSQYRSNLPHTLIRLIYQLDLSVLCSIRKLTYKHKYPSLSLTFEDSEHDKFNSIVLLYEGKSIHVQIENVDKYYTDNAISYARLFTKEKRSFSINDYFDSFIKHLIFKPCGVSKNIEYLIVYTNSGLDLTEGKKLKKGRFKKFYPFEFYSINMEESNMLKDFLFTNDTVQERGFYQFSQDKTRREEVLKRLEFSSAMRKAFGRRNFSQEFEKEIKGAFLDKLVFAVNQPNREELNSIVKSEIEKNSEVQDDYIALQERILRDITVSEKHTKFGSCISGIIYEFNLLMSFLHSMFLHKNIFSINFEGKSHCISNDISINYKDRITYVKAHDAASAIDYGQLFPSRQQEGKNKISINKHFALFVEKLGDDIRYFIIYTNTDLNLTEEKRLKKGQSREFYPLKFDSIDIQKKRYKVLRDCSCINENGLYQFAQEQATRAKILGLLKLPSFLQKENEEGRVSNEDEKEMKEKFLDRLIFAVNQCDREELNSLIRNEIHKSNVPYNREELHEIALRWLESHELNHITKGIMKKLFEDIKDNRSSYQKIRNKDIEKVKFAKSVVGKEGTPAFDRFLVYLTKGEGQKCLEVLKRRGISLPNISSILCGAKANAARTFKGLYDLWFDEQGNKTEYLKTLETEKINLASMSSILNGAGSNAPKAFKELYDLWFNKQGNKTKYLKALEKEEISLPNMSSILSGAGVNAPKAFKELYDLWFDGKRNKSQHLKTLEGSGVNLSNVSGILGGAGANAAKAFKDLYNLWFDEEGNKTEYLKTLEERGINLSNVSSILGGAGANAAKAFKDLYNLWFDEKGKKTEYLKTLEKEGINLASVSSILNKARANAAKVFKDLYDLWFDEKGNKTEYLKNLEKEEINLSNMSGILCGAGADAAKVFKDLYDVCFDETGNKTQRLRTLKKEGLNLSNMSNILHGARVNAAKAFKDLYNLWFDEKGNKTKYLKTLEKEGINLSNISSILGGAGANAAKAFKDLYDLSFNEQGNKSEYLKTLEKEGIGLSNMFSILSGAGASAAKAFKELYDAFFDRQGNKTQRLKHFTKKIDGKKGFKPSNLSSILGRAGANAKDAFEKLHSICFNNEGGRTRLLDDFYKAGFKSSNLSCILCGAGANASSILKRLHNIFFNDEGERTKLLDGFYKAGFRPYDLSNMLSRAVDSVENFYDFCFVGETKKYLNHFLKRKKCFTLSNLCNILHGAGANICSAFKDFHDICFDEAGNEMQLLDDFYKVGFSSNDLSDILSMAGSNAASILRDLHELCFSKENYLYHFLAEDNHFTPKGLSKILYGIGTKISPTFGKLHNLCFDEAGNKTNYLNNLIKSNTPNKILDILYKKVRNAPSTSLDVTLLQQQNISGIKGSKIIKHR
ncbi:uncharacterized protein LOC143368613 isoform X2 [Andrena cerasifolii]|uniref:uncharacterized protein LOC143368613 isoform X2 n=1 Tax=Andrena cerasifolii TaxID=2819439 RepID=UPI00403787B5